MYGELRLSKVDGDYLSIYVLPKDSTDSVRISVKTDSDVGREVGLADVGTQVAFRLTPPRLATSRRTGNQYLAGLQILSFFTE